MEISEQANDRKLEELTSTLTAKMDINQTYLVEDNASIKASNTSILAGLQHVLSRLPPEAPAAVAVPVTGPLPAATIAPHQSLALPPNRVDQDDESPRKRKSAFGDMTEIRERLYNKADDQQHQQQHQHKHQQYHITTLTPDNSQASK